MADGEALSQAQFSAMTDGTQEDWIAIVKAAGPFSRGPQRTYGLTLTEWRVLRTLALAPGAGFQSNVAISASRVEQAAWPLLVGHFLKDHSLDASGKLRPCPVGIPG